jgi:hypothetical protein
MQDESCWKWGGNKHGLHIAHSFGLHWVSSLLSYYNSGKDVPPGPSRFVIH